MEWRSTYIIYRINSETILEEVYHGDDLKKVKYWLRYIAQPGDVLCRTPIHAKHSHAGTTAEYRQHKGPGGKVLTNQEEWFQSARAKSPDLEFPEEQLRDPLVERRSELRRKLD